MTFRARLINKKNMVGWDANPRLRVNTLQSVYLPPRSRCLGNSINCISEWFHSTLVFQFHWKIKSDLGTKQPMHLHVFF